MAVVRLRPIETEAQIRAERNRRLTESDWTQMGDSPLASGAQGKWKKYRKALRDMNFTDDFPLSPDQEALVKPTGVRAHKKDGKFKADDKSTPNVNEAYVDGKTPKKRKSKKKV